MFSALVLTAIWPGFKATVHETEHSPSYAKPKKFATKYHVEEINSFQRKQKSLSIFFKNTKENYLTVSLVFAK